MLELQDTVADGTRRRIAKASALATIGKVVAPLDVAPASAVKATGIFILDRNLGGGLPSGSVVYLSGDPESMTEIFLHQFTQTRKTYYVVTGRRPKYVAQNIRSMGYDISEITFIDIYSEYYLTAQGELVDNVGNEYVDNQIVDFMICNLQNIETEEDFSGANILFDTFSFFLNLSVNVGQIRKLMNVIYETTKELDGMTYLYGLKNTHDRTLENEIINACDVVFDIELLRNSDEIVSRLSIPKIRGMSPITDMLKFKISEGIQIDTSTDIA
ncbi:MAG: ATPase domain-containing protein [Euryarchaeota archaeon]|nr:ATPase domain-containing protein [Euryarchaeota archaeon]